MTMLLLLLMMMMMTADTSHNCLRRCKQRHTHGSNEEREQERVDPFCKELLPLALQVGRKGLSLQRQALLNGEGHGRQEATGRHAERLHAHRRLKRNAGVVQTLPRWNKRKGEFVDSASHFQCKCTRCCQHSGNKSNSLDLDLNDNNINNNTYIFYSATPRKTNSTCLFRYTCT